MKFFSISLFTILFISIHSVAQDLNLSYQEGSTELKGFFQKPDSKIKAPGIVVIHAWMGITSHEKNTVHKLAQLGYYALLFTSDK